MGSFFGSVIDIGVGNRVGAVDLEGFGGWGPGESCVVRI